MDLTGEADGEQQKVGAPAADMLAGQDAAFAVVAALFPDCRDGKGRTVDIALVNSMTRFLTCRIVPYPGSGDVPRRSGGKDSVIAIYQAFATADFPITLGLGNDSIWRRFWQAVGRPEVAEHPGYGSNAERRSRRAEIVGLIQEILRTKPRAHWLALFATARVPAGPINRINEVAADPELQRRGLFYRLAADERETPQVGTEIILDGQCNRPQPAYKTRRACCSTSLQSLLGYRRNRNRRPEGRGGNIRGNTHELRDHPVRRRRARSEQSR